MLLTMGRKSDYDSNVSGEWASDTLTINEEREKYEIYIRSFC